MDEIKLEPFSGFEAFKKRNAERRLQEQTLKEPHIDVSPTVNEVGPTQQPVGKKLEERWTVYKFTLPTRFSKKIATGFESREEAETFIKTKLIKKDNEGKVVPKYMKLEDDKEYLVAYDVILESREEVDIYYNDPTITTVGNDKEAALRRYMEESPKLEIIRDVRWIG